MKKINDGLTTQQRFRLNHKNDLVYKKRKAEEDKKYYEKNRQEILNYHKRYGNQPYIKKKERIRQKLKYQNNKDWYREYQKVYHKLEKYKEKQKIYRESINGRLADKNSHHKRKLKLKITDIDSKWLNNLFNKTIYCELCKCKLDNNGKKYPNGKQLDHITPLMVGGTHTKNNVRFICWKCNAERPKDGSDNLQLIFKENKL